MYRRYKGEGALNKLAALFEIEEEDMYVRAEKVADAVLADLYLPEYEKMKLVKRMLRVRSQQILG